MLYYMQWNLCQVFSVYTSTLQHSENWSPHGHQHLVSSIFFILAILISIVISSCALNLHLLITNEVEPLFICLFASWISSLLKGLFKGLAHFSTVCLFFSYFFLYFLIGSLGQLQHCKYSFPFCGLLLHSLLLCFDKENFNVDQFINYYP